MTATRRRIGGFVAVGLLVALVLAFAVSRFASSEPDGLEKVAADQGIDTGATDHALADGPFADYSTKGVDDPGQGKGIAGVVGVVVTFAIAGGVAFVVTRRTPADRPAS
ncbi:MAG: PDGLE domain-containing protein [Acidimicrobiales bacterium]